jgi:predicted GIY-YIG superfamily endonuclease
VIQNAPKELKMQTSTIKGALNSESDLGKTKHCVYVVRNGDTVLYVGKVQSGGIRKRILMHLGMNGPTRESSPLGNLIRYCALASDDWQFDLYTVEDCNQFLAAHDAEHRVRKVNTSERALIHQSIIFGRVSTFRVTLHLSHSRCRSLKAKKPNVQINAGSALTLGSSPDPKPTEHRRVRNSTSAADDLSRSHVVSYANSICIGFVYCGDWLSFAEKLDTLDNEKTRCRVWQRQDVPSPRPSRRKWCWSF